MKISNQQGEKGEAQCFPRSQHGSSNLFHTHKSDQLKIETQHTLDKLLQTLIKADLGMGTNSNLHLVMFHIWTLNVLREKSKLKKIHMLYWLLYWNIGGSWRKVQSSNETPRGFRSLRQYPYPLLSLSVPLSVPKPVVSFSWYLAFANHFPLCLKFSRRNLHFIDGLHPKAYAMLIPDSNLATTDPLSLFPREIWSTRLLT